MLTRRQLHHHARRRPCRRPPRPRPRPGAGRDHQDRQHLLVHGPRGVPGRPHEALGRALRRGGEQEGRARRPAHRAVAVRRGQRVDEGRARGQAPHRAGQGRRDRRRRQPQRHRPRPRPERAARRGAAHERVRRHGARRAGEGPRVGVQVHRERHRGDRAAPRLLQEAQHQGRGHAERHRRLRRERARPAPRPGARRGHHRGLRGVRARRQRPHRPSSRASAAPVPRPSSAGR